MRRAVSDVKSRSPCRGQIVKAAPWRPPASTSPLAKSFVLRQTVCKRLIFLKWHGRGREFESHQVHQNKAQQNIDLRKWLCASTSRKRSRGVHLESKFAKIWTPASGFGCLDRDRRKERAASISVLVAGVCRTLAFPLGRVCAALGNHEDIAWDRN